MAVMKRNARWFGLGGVLFALLLAIWFMRLPYAPAAFVVQSYPPLGDVDAARIDQLRRDAGLDDDVLACCDLTDEQLETLLSATRSWFDTNDATLAAAVSDIADQRALIRFLRSEIANGRDETQRLREAKAALAQAEAAHAALVSAVRTGVLGGLSPSQRTLADLMLAGGDLVMPYRILGLNDTQRDALSQTRSRYHQRLSVARSAQTRAGIHREYVSALQSAIGATNVQKLAALAAYRGAASQRVVAAVQLVLPRDEQG